MSISDKSTILIVDDNQELADYLKDIVTGMGCHTLLANDGEIAIIELIQKKVDVVITDLRMPNASGVELAQSMRANGFHQPIVVVSAYADDEMRKTLNEYSPVVIFEKPFDFDKFQQAISDMLVLSLKTQAMAELTGEKDSGFVIP